MVCVHRIPDEEVLCFGLLDCFCSSGSLRVCGGCSFQKGGGIVAEFNVRQINKALCKAIRVCEAVKQLIKAAGFKCDDIGDITREIRKAAAECQKHIAPDLGLDQEKFHR